MKGQVTLVVVLSHFMAAFTALGLPPYLTEALKTFGDGQEHWAGVLYILPTTCVALSAPFWGKLADRYGTRPLLIRAQLGLALSYLLTSQATSVEVLALSLMLQGLLGGTFAASSAYLGNQLQGGELSRALTLMQSSARLALLLAPLLIGVLIQHHTLLDLYGSFAVLPLLSALLTLGLPSPEGRHKVQQTPRVSLKQAQPTFWLEFLFVLSTILGFPYFIAHVQNFTSVPWVPGLLFALPHLAYLGMVPLLHHQRPAWGLGVGFVLVGVSMLLHLWTENPVLIAILRLILGIGMALCITRINDQAAELARTLPRGQLFGVLESYGKGGAVVAGILASLLSQHPEWAYWLGGTLAITSVVLTLQPSRHPEVHPETPS